MDLNTIGALTFEEPASPSQQPITQILRARSTSPADREQRREQGKCVRCGGYGHWVKECPAKAYNDKTLGSGPSKIVVSALDVDTEDEELGSDEYDSDRETFEEYLDRLHTGKGI